ncbi:hypothetical protein HDV05_003005, partial [Chytridiales sp. JEL 0842]
LNKLKDSKLGSCLIETSLNNFVKPTMEIASTQKLTTIDNIQTERRVTERVIYALYQNDSDLNLMRESTSGQKAPTDITTVTANDPTTEKLNSLKCKFFELIGNPHPTKLALEWKCQPRQELADIYTDGSLIEGGKMGL